MFTLRIFTVLIIISALQAANLPTYLTRCSLDDPKLEECFKKNSNLVIRDIIKGDIHYDIQSAIPLKYGGPIVKKDKNLQMIVTNLEIHGLESSKVTEVQLDFENGTLRIVLEIPSITAYAHCEAIGHLHGIPETNNQILHEKLVEATFTHNKNFTVIDIDDVKFVKSISHTDDLKVKNQYNGFFIGFSDIKEQKTTCQEKLPSVVETKIGDYISSVLEGLVTRVPIEDFF